MLGNCVCSGRTMRCLRLQAWLLMATDINKRHEDALRRCGPASAAKCVYKSGHQCHRHCQRRRPGALLVQPIANGRVVWCDVIRFGSTHQTVVQNQCWNRDEFSPRLNERSVRSDERNASCSLSCSLFHVGGPLRGSCVGQLRSGRGIKCPRRRRAHLLNANLWNRRAREIQRRQMMPLLLPRQLLATTIDGRTRLGMASTSDATSLRVDLRRGSVGSKWHRLASHPIRLRPTRCTAVGDR